MKILTRGPTSNRHHVQIHPHYQHESDQEYITPHTDTMLHWVSQAPDLGPISITNSTEPAGQVTQAPGAAGSTTPESPGLLGSETVGASSAPLRSRLPATQVLSKKGAPGRAKTRGVALGLCASSRDPGSTLELEKSLKRSARAQKKLEAGVDSAAGAQEAAALCWSAGRDCGDATP